MASQRKLLMTERSAGFQEETLTGKKKNWLSGGNTICQEEKQFAQMRPISDFGESWTGGVVVNHYYEEDELNEHEE